MCVWSIDYLCIFFSNIIEVKRSRNIFIYYRTKTKIPLNQISDNNVTMKTLYNNEILNRCKTKCVYLNSSITYNVILLLKLNKKCVHTVVSSIKIINFFIATWAHSIDLCMVMFTLMCYTHPLDIPTVLY